MDNITPDVILERELALTFSAIGSKTGLSDEVVSNHLYILKEVGDIRLFEEDDYNEYYIITTAGIAAVHDGKYLEIGKKEFGLEFDNVLKRVSTIILLLIAIITFIFNLVQTYKNKTEIDQLKKQVDSIGLSKHPLK